MTEPKKRSASTKVPFTLETVREEILAKLAKAGAKGTASIITAAAKEPKRSLLAQALAVLEVEARIYVDRSGKKPKYLAGEYKPTVETIQREILAKLATVAEKGVTSFVTATTSELKRSLLEQALTDLEAGGRIYVDRNGRKAKYLSNEYKPRIDGIAKKIEQFAARWHPQLLTVAELMKALAPNEKGLASKAFETLEADRQLVKLNHKTSVVFAHGESLRAMLGVADKVEVDGPAIHHAYRDLVRLTGFPDVGIATLQRHSEVPMSTLKNWLIEEHRQGRAVFGLGDWSLADAETRAGVIELRGERYLFVRLKGEL
jgi:hypothetical protein